MVDLCYYRVQPFGGDVSMFAELASMQDRLRTCDGDALEEYYRGQCEALDPNVAKRIAKVDFNYYNDRQYDAYCKALKKAKSAQALAIYYEYDIDNDWHSSFFVCKEYAPLEAGDDDWACKWIAAVPGSCIPEFTRIYNATDKFGKTPHAIAVTLYLIARTTVAVKNLAARKSPGNLKLCMGYHDQDPIHRLNR